VPGVPQLAVQGERAVGRRRILHVDPHESAARVRIVHDRLGDLAAQDRIEVEPEAGQLDRDPGLEAFGRQASKDVVIQPCGRAPFALRRRTTRSASSIEGPAMYRADR
jgi:hypothetical protein